MSLSVWPDRAIYCALGNFSKLVATIILSKSPTFLSNFWKGVKIFYFSSEIILETFTKAFGDYTGHTGLCSYLQYDQMSTLFFNIWSFPSMKFCPTANNKIAKVGSKFCQILNIPSKDCQRLIRFCQCGEISLNLVTLFICFRSLFTFTFLLPLTSLEKVKPKYFYQWSLRKRNRERERMREKASFLFSQFTVKADLNETRSKLDRSLTIF